MNNIGIKGIFIECGQDSGQTSYSLFMEEDACHAINDRGQGSPCSISNNGSSACLGFQGSDPKIFFTGKNESTAMCIIMNYLFIGESA